MLVSVLLAVIIAAIVYWLCLALGLPSIVAIVAVLLILIAAVGNNTRLP